MRAYRIGDREFEAKHFAILDSAFAVGLITNFVIDMSIKHLLKHDMLFQVESNYYRRRKLKDLCNLILKP